MAKRLMKYNPAFLTDEELIDAFVVRNADFQLVLQVVNDNVTKSNQHVLVIGPRGIGKTMLVLRVAAEIRRTKKLADRWYPLVFGEESYEVATPGEFWLEALFHLHKQTKDLRWERTFEELQAEPAEERLRERALAQLMDFADAKGKRILLVVENLNMLLGDQVSHDDAWVLRHTLLNEPRIMLLASATTRFEETENSGKAMFELFRQHELKPLNTKECRAVWESVTGEDPGYRRVRPIEILTGGNPRLVTIVSAFAAQRSLRELMEDLLQLVDDHTDYFKGNLDSLPSVERKVYLALAGLWKPSTARQVGKAARLEVSKTSSFLNRLIGRGVVTVARQRGRTKSYQIAERLYNIYYLMRRHGAPSYRVRAVVEFMTAFYPKTQLPKLMQQIAEEAMTVDPEVRRDHFLVLEGIIDKSEDSGFHEKLVAAMPREFFSLPDIPASIRSLLEQVEVKREAASPVWPKVLLEYWGAESSEAMDEAFASFKKANQMHQAGRLKEAERLCRKTIERAPRLWWGWLQMSLIHRMREKNEEAENAVRTAIKLEHDSPFLWTYLGLMLITQPNRRRDAEQALLKAIELDAANPDDWLGWGHLLRDNLHRPDLVEQVYRDFPEFQSTYAEILLLVGLLLSKQFDRHEDAGRALRKATKLAPANATAWAKLGNLLHDHLENYHEAEQAYRKATELDPTELAPRKNLVLLLLSKQQRPSEGLTVAQNCLATNQGDASLLNEFAWQFYRHGPDEMLSDAEAWAREAVELEPDSARCQHTLATILAAQGEGSEALELARGYLEDVEVVKKTLEQAIELFVELAAAGFAAEAVDVLRRSPSAGQLEPLIVGLQLLLGEEVDAPTEIVEVGKDVVERIEKVREKRQAGSDASSE